MKVFQKIRSSPWIAHTLALLGGALFLLQAVIYAYIQTSFLDEGGYLYIGDLYMRGILKPFQDFAVPRWYAPLAFLIPGQIEKWFGASLLTGRLFSIVSGLTMLVALWLLARRFGGRWWGAAMVWFFTLTPIAIEIYSLALSQALVACLLAWSLLGVLGEKRPLWQILAGSVLAGLVAMTRQTLIPVIPLLIFYVFWQHGKKAGWWSLMACFFPILIIHAIYWPNILQLWAVWLPAGWTPFLNAYRFPVEQSTIARNPTFLSSLMALLQGFRFHYFSLFGFFVCLFLWPRRGGWKNNADRRAAYFLGTLFLVLALLHVWPTISSFDNPPACAYCISQYLSFFDLTALLLIVVTFPSWQSTLSKIVQGVIVFFILLLSTALGYAAFDRFGPWLMGIKFPAVTRGLDPRRLFPFITLWDILANKFHQDYWKSRVNVSFVAGLILGVLLVVLAALVYRALVKRKHLNGYSYGSLLLMTCLVMGVWLSPLMGGTYRQDGICRANIPQTYQRIGQKLASLIPPGSQVYWEVGNAVPLLYAPDIKIYPPQIYAGYSFRLDGDPRELLKYGLWNDELAKQWKAESDFIVTEADYPVGDLDANKFEEFQTIPANPCDPNSYLIVYRRKP